MKLTPSRCPVCAADPSFILETMFTATPLDPVGSNGESDYDSFRGIELLWDSISPAIADGKVTVRCAKYHEWLAEMRS